MMDKKLKAIRKRLYEDFPFYAKSALKIRTKEGEIAPLVLNPHRRFCKLSTNNGKRRKIRIIIQKANNRDLAPMLAVTYISVFPE